MKVINSITENFGNYCISPFLYPFRGSQIKVAHDGISATYRVRPWTSDKWVVWEIWGLNEYDSFLSILPTDIVVDIGAQIGVFTVFASQKANRGQVLAFEPFSENFSLLQENINLNHCQNVQAFQMAVGKINAPDTTDLFINPRNSGGHSTVAQVGDNKSTVQQISLAEIFSQNQIRKINYLKIDTEGSEFDILLTTPAKLLREIDQIGLEYHDYLSLSVKHDEIVQYLQLCGFRVEVVNYPVISQLYGLGNILATRR